ncbi:hypothetical protein SDC9_91039 [bioreactor metagenome]|uniref:Uncharacterized protein n=1 Tax=bioreactor metagenome TaxID=1076179 RepID=A0A644ZWQ6_9ZZZZ
MVRIAELALQPQAHVLHQREMREHGRDLKRADHATPRNLRRRLAGDVLTIELDGARGGLKKLGQQVEAGSLPRAVGADQCMDRAAAHGQVHIADSGETLEFLGEV